MRSFLPLMALLFGVYGILLLLGLACYVFKAIGLYRLARAQGQAAPWLAFVPVAERYVHGAAAGPIRMGKKQMNNPGLWTLLLPVGMGVAMSGMYALIFGLGFGLMGFQKQFQANYSHEAGEIGAAVAALVLVYLVFFLITIANAILRGLVDHGIYSRLTTPDMALVHTLLSLFIPVYEALCLFTLSRRVLPPPAYAPPAAQPAAPPEPPKNPGAGC